MSESMQEVERGKDKGSKTSSLSEMDWELDAKLDSVLGKLSGQSVIVNPWFNSGARIDPEGSGGGAGGAYLLRESGVASNLLRNNMAILHAKNPVAGMAAYTEEAVKVSDTQVAVYQRDFERLFAMGLPAKQCEAIALQKSKNALADELAIVGLGYPLATNPNILASAAAGVPINIAAGSPGKLSKDEKRAIYKKYRSKKKAKKSTK